MIPAAEALVLVVDDDATTRMLTVEALAVLGLETLEAEGGEAALAEFRTRSPDLVLLDVVMPDLNGFEVCRAIREDRRGRHVPIIMLTGLEGSESIDKAYEAGATDFISKPLNWTLLAHRVRYVLRASETREALAISEERLLQAQRVARMGSWNWDARSDHLDCSTTYPDLFGVGRSRRQRRLEEPLSFVHPGDREVLEEALEGLRDGQPYQVDYRTVWPDGSVHTLRDTAVPEFDAMGQVSGAHGTVQDVTEQVDAERRIRYLAYFDPLTGLPNRNAFREALEATLLRASRCREVVAILLMDLHRFGLLNDSLGREGADQVLQVVASRVRDFSREELGGGDVGDDTELAIAARFGPDQFAVMVRAQALDLGGGVDRLVSDLKLRVSAPIELMRLSLVMQVSVGFARYPDHADSAESLLKGAETALRQAKRDPVGGCVMEYSSRMREQSVGRLQLESGLRLAMDLKIGFALHYQPKVDLAAREVIGAEALMRWRDPVQGNISPGVFIPLAEEMGLIIPLSEWVIDSACRQAAAWRDQRLPRRSIAINLSASHFKFAGLVDYVVQVMDRYGLTGDDIEFELTESALVGDPAMAVQILDEFHERGLRVAVDDFGTGYSSLAYLKRFRLTTLKIDRSFVRDIETDATDAAIVSSIVAMSGSFAMGVVAEGVESIEQARHLVETGCHVMQGYLFAPPLPPEAYAAILGGHLDTLTELPPLG
ncbi:MAG: EAL domain-containing protein [Rhodocyclaceae bacterium]|nr:EAL domain-containing protein [Rhodocyclaceae bacterium]